LTAQHVTDTRLAGPGALSRGLHNAVLRHLLLNAHYRREFLDRCFEFYPQQSRVRSCCVSGRGSVHFFESDRLRFLCSATSRGTAGTFFRSPRPFRMNDARAGKSFSTILPSSIYVISIVSDIALDRDPLDGQAVEYPRVPQTDPLRGRRPVEAFHGRQPSGSLVEIDHQLIDPHDRDDHVPRDGHALLAGAGGGGNAGTVMNCSAI
jgi:hypothetical protein